MDRFLVSRFLQYSRYEEKSACEPEESDQLSVQTVEKLPELLAKLEQEIMPVWHDLDGAMEMDMAAQFARSLSALAQDHRADGIEKYAAALQEAVESFDVENLQILMGKLPSLIKSLQGDNNDHINR